MVGGQYEEATGICRKVDAKVRKIIQVDDKIIPLDDVYEIEAVVPEESGFCMMNGRTGNSARMIG